MSTPPNSPADPREPPIGLSATWRNLGPGAIIAASVLASSVFFATTNASVELRYCLLWFVVLGCVLKVFAQVELSYYCVANRQTTLAALDELPGPRFRVRWTLWLWLVMFLASLGQLGGMLGGVGQCLALTFPLTGDFAERVEIGRAQAKFDRGLQNLDEQQFLVGDHRGGPTAEELRSAYRAIGPQQFGARPVLPERLEYTWDDVIWASVVTLIVLVLLCGRYRFIERVCLLLVCVVIVLAVVNLVAVQRGTSSLPTEFGNTLCFQQPLHGQALKALVVLGIVGLGAAELIYYPYWCLEKGYARNIGPRDETEAYVQRAQGWLRVLRCDAFAALLLYTLPAVVFYLLGPAMFPSAAAIAVFSAFFAITASNARVAADAVDLFCGHPNVAGASCPSTISNSSTAAESHSHNNYDRRVRLFCWLIPLAAFGMYLLSKEPIRLVLFGGFLQANMLLVLAVAAAYFRFRRCDTRLKRSKLWDAALCISLLVFLTSGAYLVFLQGSKLVDQIVTTINW